MPLPRHKCERHYTPTIKTMAPALYIEKHLTMRTVLLFLAALLTFCACSDDPEPTGQYLATIRLNELYGEKSIGDTSERVVRRKINRRMAERLCLSRREHDIRIHAARRRQTG